MEQGVQRTRCFFNVSIPGERQTARLERLVEVVENALPEGAELVKARFSGGPLLTLFVDREDRPVDHGFCSKSPIGGSGGGAAVRLRLQGEPQRGHITR